MMLSYDRRGEGEPMLLIHGVGHHWQAWQAILKGLNEAGFQTLAIDAPGFGESPALTATVTPTVYELTTAIADFLDQLGLETVHIVGNSMGGGIALELARAGRARSVTAISPVGLWTAKELSFCQRSLRLTYRLIAKNPALISTIAGNPIGRTLLSSQLIARPWRMPAEQMRATIRALAQADSFLATVHAFDHYLLRDGPELAQVPITIAWGTRDCLLIPRQAHRARVVLAHARHVWLAGAGHIPMTDDPAMVIRTIIEGSGT